MAKKKTEYVKQSKGEGVGKPSSEKVLIPTEEATAYYKEQLALAERPDEARVLAFQKYRVPAEYSPVGENDIADALGQIRAVSTGGGRRPYSLPSFASGAELQGAIDAYWDFIYRVNQDGRKIYPDVEGLASFLRVARSTLMNWKRGEVNREFAPIMETCFNDIASVKKQLALGGNLPPLIYLNDMQNNHGYLSNTSRQDIEVTVRREPDDPQKLIDAAKFLP